jgi:NDP-sugar pyrophosphorylase family protein
VTRALILAAGFGTRLGGLSDERPKPMLPVADHPLIRWSLALLRGAGIAQIAVNTHHRGGLIEAELGSEVAYSREPEKILGTAGGIRHALALAPHADESPLIVMNGKIIVDVDLQDVLAHHARSGAAATLVVREDPDAARWGAVTVEDGQVRGFYGAGRHMFTGIHILEPSFILANLPDDGEERDIVKQGYVPWLARGVPIAAYVQRGYFQEHSTPERYLAGNINVLRGRARTPYPPGPTTGVDPTAKIEGSMVEPVRVGAGAIIERRAVVGPDAVIGARARIAGGVQVVRSVVWPDAVVTDDATDAIITPRQRITVSS